ncbi:MAG: aminopeptidase P family protein, partial [Candidatus Adiutrix sp.]|nr:aminopeptidase P family protein [Candidatus Adiutrix sp.]
MPRTASVKTDQVAGRLGGLRRMMAENQVAAALIISAANRRYFSGFRAADGQINESSGALLITRRAQYLLTDSRYAEAARREAPLFQVLTCRRGPEAELASLPALKRAGSLCFEAEFLTVGALQRLRRALPEIELAPLIFDPDALRARKNPEEIRLVARALAITEAAVGALFQKMVPGMTEREAAFFLEDEFRRLGAEGPSFETIVAAGPNAALPHASPGPRKFREGELVVVDCGARYQGYCADLTRTRVIGRARAWQKEIYAIVRQAQLLAVKAIAPGTPAGEVDRLARDYIGRHGYGDCFGHSLGHGVGLAIHEAPRLSPRNPAPLAPGQIVTVEPGIYLPGRGGVRLEQ